ncbi:MAG TPA: prolyl oligopeptidase family serine peptidase [Candidatus Limnocylindrales bacterium]|nr:prolyl oligopeptidase family serine peptidase [Candidatus Limnocylindrales bacterium]
MAARTSRSLRQPTPAILREQVVLEEHDLAPDGSFAVVTRRIVQGDEYVSHCWLVPLPADPDADDPPAEPRQLSRGIVRDRAPRISPDGTRVVFTRRLPGETDGKKRLLVLDLGGGEPFAPALGDLEPETPAWSPDGRSIAFTAETEPERFLIGERQRGEDAKAPLGRVVRTIDYRWDEEDYLDRRAQVHVVEAAEGAVPRRLTTMAGGVSQLAWRPDGRAIAFTADPRADADRHPRTSIWAVAVPDEADGDADGPVTEPSEVLALAGPVSRPAYSPDGRWLAGVGVDDPDFFDHLSPTLFVGPADGSAPAVALAPHLDRPISNWADSDLTGWQTSSAPGPRWDHDGRGVVALVTDRGRTHPWRFPVDVVTGGPAGDPVRLAHGDTMANTLAVAGGRITVTSTFDTRPPELCEAGTDGVLRRRTTMGAAWTAGIAWPELRVVEAPGPGGPIETWIASPAGAGDEPLPTVVDVHGGPLGAWAPAPSLEVVLLCARGYRVVLPNIRGSTSYGAAWIEPQLGEWGGPDADDVHAALDHVVGLGLADPDRLGALGLSYGGFMVNWLVGTTDRFRAAVSENGVTNQVAAWANSDSGPEYCRAARMGDPTTPEGVAQLWRQSPLAHVADVHTPLLMLQGEADKRCPSGDNEQFFVALRWLGRTVEYVLYPEEYHVLQASGRIDRRVDRMTRVVDWFDRYLRA